jgi:excisionase family DNA binding protein
MVADLADIWEFYFFHRGFMSNKKRLKSPLDYPVTIKKHTDFIVFQVPDLGITMVEEAPPGNKISPQFISKISKTLAKTWLKSSEKLHQYQLADKKAPEPSRQRRPIEEREEKLYTTPQVAEHLGVSENTVRRLVKRGELDCIKTSGKHRRFSELQIQRYLKQRREAIEPAPLN